MWNFKLSTSVDSRVDFRRIKKKKYVWWTRTPCYHKISKVNWNWSLLLTCNIINILVINKWKSLFLYYIRMLWYRNWLEWINKIRRVFPYVFYLFAQVRKQTMMGNNRTHIPLTFFTCQLQPTAVITPHPLKICIHLMRMTIFHICGCRCECP